jgi:DNA-binding transcriptional ArsR family regulator
VLLSLIVSHMDNKPPALDSVFHALADPTRRAVIQQLSRGKATVSELARPFDMALPSFLKHLGVLESSGLISSEKIGRVRTCKIKPKEMAVAQSWLDEQRAIWEGRTDRLAQYVETLASLEKEE